MPASDRGPDPRFADVTWARVPQPADCPFCRASRHRAHYTARCAAHQSGGRWREVEDCPACQQRRRAALRQPCLHGRQAQRVAHVPVSRANTGVHTIVLIGDQSIRPRQVEQRRHLCTDTTARALGITHFTTSVAVPVPALLCWVYQAPSGAPYMLTDPATAVL